MLPCTVCVKSFVLDADVIDPILTLLTELVKYRTFPGLVSEINVRNHKQESRPMTALMGTISCAVQP